ncbi:hypothetical protein SERLA73DRAFT_182479 [Serpula lacrymans var. lacrymans S7.3]|uniref:Uncharacterized protein n=2 Tax=Serpula lacrymans var. lacrymans TaxID=341189 RepID=F8PXH5_SERL3|nr:uncharacterized protein SERLADRAFT_469146 [Serpula lacrymans var. lacrymans S7.9]EGN99501.1 hypothetical protein SERLA73DRAFT_182479 [Serpula lacrymans var. lacrymans S7.3]EGO25055.1 hypothetical protein SERLADRAFT_469146 [Serpula lacrymans var. lacrymans S7.9]
MPLSFLTSFQVQQAPHCSNFPAGSNLISNHIRPIWIRNNSIHRLWVAYMGLVDDDIDLTMNRNKY